MTREFDILYKTVYDPPFYNLSLMSAYHADLEISKGKIIVKGKFETLDLSALKKLSTVSGFLKLDEWIHLEYLNGETIKSIYFTAIGSTYDSYAVDVKRNRDIKNLLQEFIQS